MKKKIQYRPKVKRLAVKHGLDIEIEGMPRGTWEYRVFASTPNGWSFDLDALHGIYGVGENANEAWEDLYDRLSNGYLPLDECTRECDCYAVENKNPDGSWVRQGHPYRLANDEEYAVLKAEWLLQLNRFNLGAK